jgi:hypothetical protein
LESRSSPGRIELGKALSNPSGDDDFTFVREERSVWETERRLVCANADSPNEYGRKPNQAIWRGTAT